MANHLAPEKQALALNALAEGSSIRSIERITGVHRDTIMRLGVRAGKTCQRFLDEHMQNLDCKTIEVDEIWGFIGKKKRNVKPSDLPGMGDAWTFVALDAETKIVPNFLVGRRDVKTATAFLSDLEGRLKNRVQLSTDSLNAYIQAVENSFGGEVDYGQIVKSYSSENQGKYSPPEVVAVKKSVFVGKPNAANISTSYVERQNLTMRMHCRRLTRLTNAFSKKLDNFKAAIALHFWYYNFAKVHRTIRTTPAMAAGVVSSMLTMTDLVEMI